MVYRLELRYRVGSRVIGGRIVSEGRGVMRLRGGIYVVANSEELICTTGYLPL